MGSHSPPRTPRQLPKEDGEVGETFGDLLARHPNLSPGLTQCLRAVNDHEEVLSPRVGQAISTLLSAALSPLPIKGSPRAARAALRSITTEELPIRKAKAKRLEEHKAWLLVDLSRKAAAEVEREQERAANVARQREEIAARRPKDKITREKSGRVRRDYS